MDHARRDSASMPQNLNRRSRTTAHSSRRGTASGDEDNIPSYSKRAKSRSPSRIPRDEPLSGKAQSGPRSSKSSGSARHSVSNDTDIHSDHSRRVKSTNSLQQRASRPSTPAPATHSAQAVRRDKGKERVQTSKAAGSGDAPSFSGSLAVAEFERMRKEIESLKSTLHDQKKVVKKQAKKVEELKAEAITSKATMDEQEVQLQLLKTKQSRNEELVTTIETSVSCHICMDMLNKPYSLSPCGHTFCLRDLQDWFRKAPPSLDDMDIDPADPNYLRGRQKTCPTCRTTIRSRPIPMFIVKDIVGALQKAKSSAESTSASSRRSNSPFVSEEDPWEGLFSDSEFEEDERDEDDGMTDEDGLIYSESDSDMEVQEYESDYGSSEGFDEREEEDGNMEEEEEDNGIADSPEEDEDEDEDEDDSSDEEVAYISPEWEPPCIHLSDPTMFAQANLLRRGCPTWLADTYRVRYSHREGLVAHLSSLDEDDVGAPLHGPTNRMHRIFLGWNINTPLAELSMEFGGREFLSKTLREYRLSPHRFSVHERRRGLLDVHVLVRADQVSHYYTTDSEPWQA